MGTNKITIELKKGYIKNFEKQIIATGDLDFFIPMSFVNIGDKDVITYDYTGFEALCLHNEMLNVKGVCNILEEVLHIVLSAEDNLIEPDKLNISTGTIYVNSHLEKIKLMFFPCVQEVAAQEDREEIHQNLLKKKLLRFVKELDEMHISNEAREYLASIGEYIRMNIGLIDIINRIGYIKREAFICGIH